MLLHQCLRADEITDPDRLQDLLVLMHEDATLRLILDILETIAVHLLPEIIDHLDELLVSGGLIDDVMVGLVGLGDLDLRAAVLHDLLKMILGCAQLTKLFVRDPLTGEVRRQLLQGTTHLEGILQILVGDLRDLGTTTRNHQYETFQLQLSDRFTNRCTGDTELLGELDLHKTLTRL